MFDDLLLNYYQVLLLDSMEHYDETIKYLSSYISKNDQNPFAYNNRGLAHSEIGMFNEAILDYEKSIKIKLNSIPYKNLGILFERNDLFDKALEAFNNALIINNKDATIYRCRAHIFIKLNKIQEAINDFSCAIDIDPEFAYTYFERSNLYKILNNENLSLIDLKKYNKLNK